MKKFIVWYSKTRGIYRDLIGTLYVLLIFLGGILLENRFSSLLEDQNFERIGTVIAVFVLLVFIVAGFFRREYENLNSKEIRQRRSLEIASASMQRILSDRIRESRLPINDLKVSPQQAIACLECLTGIVKHLYAQLETEFGEAELLHGRIDFEVTFMTPSYFDEKITIPAFANRSGRAPLSMNLRTENSEIYDHTVTAETFKSLRPEIRIVEDTSDPQEKYAELYDGQLDRIKSSVVYPVLDDRNKLLGTLVIHCNRERFFLQAEVDFWKELLERYASQLAFEKSRLDLLASSKLLHGEDEKLMKPF